MASAITMRLLTFVHLLHSLMIAHYMTEASTVQGCGQHGDEDTICSPNGGVWIIGTVQNITWNPMNSVYVKLKRLNITLSCMVDHQPRILKTWNEIPVQSGSLTVYPDSSYFPEPLLAGVQNKSWPAFVNLSSDESGHNAKFSFPSPAALTLLEISSASVTPPFRFQNQTTNTRSQGTNVVFDNTWLIGIAAILATGVLLCAILAVWCYIRPVGNGREPKDTDRRQSSMQSKETSAIDSELSASSNGYYPSHFKQFSNVYSDSSMGQSTQPPTEIAGTSETGATKIFHQHLGARMKALTSTDAVLLGDMFRQKMRRPDWATDSQVTELETDEQPVFGNNLKRQLLEKDVQRIDKVDIDDECEENEELQTAIYLKI